MSTAIEKGPLRCESASATRPWEALVVSDCADLALALPHLLARAGFSVDVIATSGILRSSKFVRSVQILPSENDLAPAVLEQLSARSWPYDWVIAGDDVTLKLLGSFSWPPALRPAHLPLERAGATNHLFSKIGLSRALSAGGVQTPPFYVASCADDASRWASKNGYPVLLKVDSSCSGNGVYECTCNDDIERQEALFASAPLIVQKKIEGFEMDVSAIYFDHELVHFSYARVEKTKDRFGPSVVRTYYPLPLVDDGIFGELERLGYALAADGFSNISCIEAADGSGRYYFEADLRPNVWIDFPKYFGEDPAEQIRAWFTSGTCLSRQSLKRREPCVPVIMPYFLRMKFWEVLTNRYGVWRYIPLADPMLLLEYCAPHWMMRLAAAIFPVPMRRKLRGWLRSRTT
jgi:hypothetical protein